LSTQEEKQKVCNKETLVASISLGLNHVSSRETREEAIVTTMKEKVTKSSSLASNQAIANIVTLPQRDI